MAGIFLAWPNRIDNSTLSSGSWVSGLSLNNIKDREMAVVARSTDATNASTKFIIDLGAEYPIRVVSLHNTNLSLTSRWKIKIGTTSGGSERYLGSYQSSFFLAFDDPFIPWESQNWWGTGNNDYIKHPFMSPIILPSTVNGRYITVEIDDTTNADGYVQIGRVFVGDGFTAKYDASFGLQDGWEDLSSVSYSESGADFVFKRRRRRYTKFSFDHLEHTTEFPRVYEMIRRLGTVEEVLYLPSTSDYQACQRTGYLGMLSELSPIEFPYYNGRSLGLNIKERL